MGNTKPMAALFTGVALTNVALVGAATTGTLIAGERWWSGVPNAAGVAGAAIGTTWLSAHMARTSRRSGLLLGYLVAVVGAVVCAVSVHNGVFLGMVIGMVLLGVGNGGAQLSRYAAADLYPVSRRGFAVGVVVWSGTVGAIAGPNLLTVSTSAADSLGVEAMSGPFLLAVLTGALAWLVTFLFGSRVRPVDSGESDALPLAELMRLPVTVVALTCMVTSQAAMVGVMTMTPLQMHHHGHGLDEVGAILAVHLIGMFAFSPVSGKLADRFGASRIALAGLITLVVASMCAFLSPTVDGFVAYAGMFLLGYGWNLAFVGGSGLLSAGMPPAARTRVQGIVDSLAWTASAVASVLSGVLVAGAGYGALAVVAGAGLLVTLGVIARTAVRTS